MERIKLWFNAFHTFVGDSYSEAPSYLIVKEQVLHQSAIFFTFTNFALAIKIATGRTNPIWLIRPNLFQSILHVEAFPNLLQ